MRQVKTLYEHHKTHGHFPEAETVVACAQFRGAVALPDQLAIMQENLREIGHNPTIRTYKVPGDRDMPGQGTLIVIFKGDTERPVLYLEDRPVESVPATKNKDHEFHPTREAAGKGEVGLGGYTT